MKRFVVALISRREPRRPYRSPESAQATVTGFVAGRIIDDGVFTDTLTMSASDIQRFLESKVPTCDTWGTQMYNSTLTRAQFAATLSTPQYPPFTCVKDYSENGISAAQIIYNIAQQYQINPQVLIVLLQKEQGLITDTWPYASQYQKATGYGCPDTGTCNTLYYGFTNQLTRAANMYRSILNASPTWYTPYVLRTTTISYITQIPHAVVALSIFKNRANSGSTTITHPTNQTRQLLMLIGGQRPAAPMATAISTFISQVGSAQHGHLTIRGSSSTSMSTPIRQRQPELALIHCFQETVDSSD